jgi:hypothetical protein
MSENKQSNIISNHNDMISYIGFLNLFSYGNTNFFDLYNEIMSIFENPVLLQHHKSEKITEKFDIFYEILSNTPNCKLCKTEIANLKNGCKDNYLNPTIMLRYSYYLYERAIEEGLIVEDSHQQKTESTPNNCKKEVINIGNYYLF